MDSCVGVVALGEHRSSSRQYVISWTARQGCTWPRQVRQHGGSAAPAAAGPGGRRRRERAHTYAHTARPRRPPPLYHNYLVSVLNEIHHQQNSIQINKILHEHGIKHKSKKTLSVENDA